MSRTNRCKYEIIRREDEYHNQIPLYRSQADKWQERRRVDREVCHPRCHNTINLDNKEYQTDCLRFELPIAVLLRQVLRPHRRHITRSIPQKRVGRVETKSLFPAFLLSLSYDCDLFGT